MTCDQIHDDGSIAIQPIESNEGLAWQKIQCGLIGNDHGESPYQLASVISIARSSTGEEPLMRVILPMVLQIRETMVLQGVERKGKGNPPHFCVFGLPVALMRKHGFAEKLHQK